MRAIKSKWIAYILTLEPSSFPQWTTMSFTLFFYLLAQRSVVSLFLLLHFSLTFIYYYENFLDHK